MKRNQLGQLSIESLTDPVSTHNDSLPSLFSQPTKDVSFLTGARVNYAPVYKFNNNKILRNKYLSQQQLTQQYSPTYQQTNHQKLTKVKSDDKLGNQKYFKINKNGTQNDSNPIKLCHLLSYQLENNENQTHQVQLIKKQSEKVLPDLELNNRFTCNYSPKKKRKSEVKRKFLESNQFDCIFVQKADLFDLTQYKYCSISRNLHKNIKDPYKRREKIIKYLQEKMELSADYHQLFLGNNEPFQFFEEVPAQFNLIFLGKHSKCDFWVHLQLIHKINTNQKQQFLNKILNAVQEMKTLKELNKFIIHKQYFENYMSNIIYSDDFDPLLFKTEPDRLEELYQSEQELDEEEIIKGLQKNCKLVKKRSKQKQVKKKKEKNKDDEESLDSYDDDKTDFTKSLVSVKTKDMVNLLQSNGMTDLNRKRPKSKHLKLKNYYQEIQKSQSYVQKNNYHRNKYLNVHQAISQHYPLMMANNVPYFLNKTGFDRYEIHEIYARYKALLGLECEKLPGLTKESIPHGIDFDNFYNGFEEMSMAPYGVLDHLFSTFAKSSTLDFEGFLNIVNLIKAKKTEDKIELILKIMDENSNGQLSYDEIVDRCNIMLDEMLQNDKTELSLGEMSQYITKQIFKAVQVDQKDEIPIHKIRQLIESNSQEAQVLIMMCCGDVNYLK